MFAASICDLPPGRHATDLLSPHRSIATPKRTPLCHHTARSPWPWAPSASRGSTARRPRSR
eukprot:4423323-Prymnesium_polylepis.1